MSVVLGMLRYGDTVATNFCVLTKFSNKGPSALKGQALEVGITDAGNMH